MSSKLYKYLGPTVLNPVLSKKGECQFKCSFPKDLNDPYELFLTINFRQDPDLLATYKDTVGELPQLPITCFSKSPIVIPMWAHYANGHQGVVVEIDESILRETMPSISIAAVDYREHPSEELLDMLLRAARIKKPRYHYLLQRGVFSAAYFTKLSCWSYEEEIRLVANEGDVKKIDNNMLISLPSACVTALISGRNATEDTKLQARGFANDIGASYFEIKIGKSVTAPYFVDSEDLSYVFKAGAIQECGSSCRECSEPTSGEYDLCPWCAVTEDHQYNASRSNPLRIFQHYGLLEEYYRGMDEISGKPGKKK